MIIDLNLWLFIYPLVTNTLWRGYTKTSLVSSVRLCVYPFFTLWPCEHDWDKSTSSNLASKPWQFVIKCIEIGVRRSKVKVIMDKYERDQTIECILIKQSKPNTCEWWYGCFRLQVTVSSFPHWARVPPLTTILLWPIFWWYYPI